MIPELIPEVPQLVDHLFRREAGRMVAVLTRLLGTEHLGLAEDVVQEALIKALRTWPFQGVPDNPGGWLMRVAKNRALDLLRRDINLARKEEELRGWTAALTSPAGDPADPDGEALDDQLRMIFICCQPAVPRDARVALTLKIVGGFGVPEIARAYLAKDATIAQRLVRAKRKIQEIRPPFEVPAPAELPAALDSVLEALYLMFNEGYAASAGEELVRQDVCAEAIRLARLVAEHPSLDLPKAHALAALLLLQAARNPARVDPEGNLLLLSEQDRDLWDRSKIAAGFHHLDRAARGTEMSTFHLEAGIAAAHAMAPSDEATDWPYILSLYDSLLALKGSPVVALNRAVALAMAKGPEAGIAAAEEIRHHPALAGYYPLPVTLGELYARAGDEERAADSFRAALEAESPEPVRRRIQARLLMLGAQ
ncbi:MAG TPA: sigma-70 family RNA polymerase sigma factor [Thermoanaerobaculia bacterium]|jgi:RNA polymerase sigma-70 factor (ECF subfamily)